MAAWAAALIGAGTSNSGWPMLRLTGSFSDFASSKTRRTPDASMWRMRSAIQRSADIVRTPGRRWGCFMDGGRCERGDRHEACLQEKESTARPARVGGLRHVREPRPDLDDRRPRYPAV